MSLLLRVDIAHQQWLIVETAGAHVVRDVVLSFQ
jgi:hypothetical protein